MSDLTDDELPGYCWSHCRTERALFHSSHVNRMLALAGYPEGYVRQVSEGWYSVYSDIMDPLVELAELASKSASKCQHDPKKDRGGPNDDEVIRCAKCGNYLEAS